MTNEEYTEFLRGRREAGLAIDPANAEVVWKYARVLDPYGVGLDDDLSSGVGLDDDLDLISEQIEREYFARSPGSDIWVNFSDLPPEIAGALFEMHKDNLGFPEGLGLFEGMSFLEQGAALIEFAYSIAQHADKTDVTDALLASFRDHLSDLEHKISTVRDWLGLIQGGLGAAGKEVELKK